jgi:hypothetical protein
LFFDSSHAFTARDSIAYFSLIQIGFASQPEPSLRQRGHDQKKLPALVGPRFTVGVSHFKHFGPVSCGGSVEGSSKFPFSSNQRRPAQSGYLTHESDARLPFSFGKRTRIAAPHTGQGVCDIALR